MLVDFAHFGLHRDCLRALWVQSWAGAVERPRLKTTVSEAISVERGEEGQAWIEVHNAGGLPVRIVGCAEECGVDGCVSMKTPLPITVAPRQSLRLEVVVKGREGAHTKHIRLFTDSGGLVELDCAVEFSVY